jgi:uncharacterized linocin/CFP29 family protein
MNHLLREKAPIPGGVWNEIDEEARRILKLNLSARRLVDVDGPLGWGCSAVPLGRVEPVEGSPDDEICVVRRRAQELIELWAPFELDRRELEAAERGAADADYSPVARAAERIARAEDRAVFHGFAAGGIQGIAEATPHAELRISDDYTQYPGTVIEAVETLREAGVDGPYGLALGPRCYTGLAKAIEPSGYPVMQRLRKLFDGTILRAPAADGAFVLSQRGGDFELTLGEDLSIGYLSHTDQKVKLYLLETFTFRPIAPEAAVRLAYA